MNEQFNILDVINLLKKWKNHILIFTICTTVLSAIISFFIDNKYMTRAVFYPANLQLYDKQTLFNNKQVYSSFGDDADEDRLISIAESDTLAREIVLKFDLINHYKIKSNDNGLALYKAVKEFSGNFDILKNDQGALELKIIDKIPQKALDMNKSMLKKLDSIYYFLSKSSNTVMLSVLDKQLKEKENELTKVYDSIMYVRYNYNIIQSNSQGKELAKELTKAQTDVVAARAQYNVYKENLSKKDTLLIIAKAKLMGLEEKMQILTKSKTGFVNVNDFKKGSELVDFLTARKNYLFQEVNALRTEKSQLEKSQIQKSSTIHIIQQPTLPIKKISPVRSLIILGVAFFSFLISIFGILMIESMRKM